MLNFLEFINLHKGEEDKQKVLDTVRSSTSFRGSNLWILACAIVVASVGLNVNSTAVIIGAMLISPLMGPIVGAGFGLGIYDFALLRKSLKNLFIATIVSLFVSAVYFFLSPFKETQGEILARTAPNIYDILIAFFGGLVGVIAITRVEKGNPIPGVAIATALMPPLCTAGYGLAIGNFRFFLGAMYLYTINCVFICIATFLIVKYLKYPPAKLVDAKRQKLVRQVMTWLIVVMIVPSVYFAYILFEERKYSQRVDNFLAEEFTNKGNIIIFKKTAYNKLPRTIELAFLDRRFSEAELRSMRKKLIDHGLPNTVLKIRQDTTDVKKDILNEINQDRTKISEKDAIIMNLRKEIDQNKFDTKSLLAEVQTLFPSVSDIYIGNQLSAAGNAKTVMIYVAKSKLSSADEAKLQKWAALRLKKQQVVVFWEELKS